MPFLQSIFCLGLPLVSLVAAHPTPDSESIDAGLSAKWDELVRAVPGESLRSAIDSNLRPKYRDGIFEDEHDAIVAIKSDDPNLASMLVDVAKQDALVKKYLRKRQDTNATVTVIETSTATAVVPPTTTEVSTQIITSQGQSSDPLISNETPGASAPASTVVVTNSIVVSEEAETTTMVTSSILVGGSPSDTEGQTIPVTLETSSLPSISTTSSTQEQGSLVSTGSSPTSGSGASSTNPAPAPAPEVSQTTQTGVLIPVVTTGGDGSVGTTNAFDTTAPTTIAIPVTTTNSAGQALTTSSIAGAAIISATNAQGSVQVTTSPLSNVAVGPGGGIIAQGTTTDAQGNVVIVTSQAGGGTVSQLRIFTSTLPDGRQRTITSFTNVGGATQAAGEESADPSSTEDPSLQSGAVSSSSWIAASVAVLMSGALGFVVSI